MDYKNLTFKRKLLWERELSIKAMAKQSAKFGNGFAFTPAKQKKFVRLIQEYVKKGMPAEPHSGPLELQLVCVFPFTSKTKKAVKVRGHDWMDVRPDYDNLAKPLNDALNDIIIKDDGNICRAIVTKLRGPQELIYLRLSELTWE